VPAVAPVPPLDGTVVPEAWIDPAPVAPAPFPVEGVVPEDPEAALFPTPPEVEPVLAPVPFIAVLQADVTSRPMAQARGALKRTGTFTLLVRAAHSILETPRTVPPTGLTRLTNEW
jgi:hypothetical protein